jgi:prepilin-type N-terminal cleavage/methylation domain-containing protein
MRSIEKKHSNSSESGFTLLEMLVAVTLVAMMAVGLWAVFRISIRSWSRGTEFIDRNQRHRSILDLVRKQIASAYPLFTKIDLQQNEPSYLIFSGAENSLRFVSLNSLRFQESPGLTLVSYEVARDSSGNYALVEKEARYTGQTLDQETTLNLSTATPIFGNLLSCTFEYFDPGDNDNSSEWVREWEGKDQRQLPVAVSITMESRDPQGNSLNRHMVVPIQAQVNNLQVNPVNPFGGRIRAIAR